MRITEGGAFDWSVKPYTVKTRDKQISGYVYQPFLAMNEELDLEWGLQTYDQTAAKFNRMEAARVFILFYQQMSIVKFSHGAHYLVEGDEKEYWHKWQVVVAME